MWDLKCGGRFRLVQYLIGKKTKWRCYKYIIIFCGSNTMFGTIIHKSLSIWIVDETMYIKQSTSLHSHLASWFPALWKGTYVGDESLPDTDLDKPKIAPSTQNRENTHKKKTTNFTWFDRPTLAYSTEHRYKRSTIGDKLQGLHERTLNLSNLSLSRS